MSLYANLAYSRAIGKDIVSSQFDFSAADLQYISGRWIHLDHDQRWTDRAAPPTPCSVVRTAPTRLSADLLVGSGVAGR